jgi:ankyrin repeat protein
MRCVALVLAGLTVLALAWVLAGPVSEMRRFQAIRTAISQGDHSTVARLLEAGVDPNKRWTELGNARRERYTLLHLAAEHSSAEVVRSLLEHGAEIDAKAGAKWTPLLIACDRRNTKVAKVLLDYNADTQQVNSAGRTAIMLAARQDDAALVSLLIDSGADVLAVDMSGWDALCHAAESSTSVQIVRVLRHAGANPRRPIGDGICALEIARRRTDTAGPDILDALGPSS